MRDLIKDDEAFNNYLIKELGMTPNASKALLDASFSFLEVRHQLHVFHVCRTSILRTFQKQGPTPHKLLQKLVTKPRTT
jgi:hypothetical protein